MKPWFSRLQLSGQEKTVLVWASGFCILVWIALSSLLVKTYGWSGVAYADVTPGGSIQVTREMPQDVATDHPTPTATWWPAVKPLIPPSPPATLTPTPNVIGVSPLPLDDKTTVFALLGIDEKHGSGVWRTDSIMLAFVQTKTKRIALISIPRDLWVAIPGHGYNRINTVDALGERSHYPGGGRGLLDETLRYNLGVPVDHYVRIDFQGFVDVVDTLGGVTVYVDKPLTDEFPDPLSPTGTSKITLAVGDRRMDGHMALSYCRSRMTTSDFDRSHRQQQVLKALWKQVMTPKTITRAPQLWKTLEGSFETDLSMTDALLLARLFQDMDPEDMHSVNLGFETARPWTTSDGAQVLLPQTQAIQQIILGLLNE